MKEQTAAEKIIKLFNMAEWDKLEDKSHGAVAKAIREKGLAGKEYVTNMNNLTVDELSRDYEKEVRDKIESKKEKK